MFDLYVKCKYALIFVEEDKTFFCKDMKEVETTIKEQMECEDDPWEDGSQCSDRYLLIEITNLSKITVDVTKVFKVTREKHNV